MRLMLASLALLACGAATAQGYPNRLTLVKPEISDKLVGTGAEVAPSSSLEMEQFFKQQLASWGTKIRNAGIMSE